MYKHIFLAILLFLTLNSCKKEDSYDQLEELDQEFTPNFNTQLSEYSNCDNYEFGEDEFIVFTSSNVTSISAIYNIEMEINQDFVILSFTKHGGWNEEEFQMKFINPLYLASDEDINCCSGFFEYQSITHPLHFYYITFNFSMIEICHFPSEQGEYLQCYVSGIQNHLINGESFFEGYINVKLE